MNAPFKTIPGRDASAVIRGFFYQIEQTILHWFGLCDAEVLELENGEDVDVVRKALVEGDLNRILGQVKLRSAPVSLHSGEILESLVNFLRHRENNPGQKLQLRFITTAKPTMERKRIEGQRDPGLLLWKAISENRGSPTPPSAQLRQIRSLMLRGTRPSKVSTEIWNRFLALWNRNDTEVLDFICAVSWGLSSDAIQQLGHEIETELVDKLHVAQHAAPDAHIRLVFYVMNRLSMRGDKRLTRTELADELTKIENLSVNPTLLRIVRDTVSHEAQLSRIEQGLKAITETLANADISPQMRNVQVAPAVPELTTGVPPLVLGASQRSRNVDRLLEALGQVTWLHLLGSSGSGKTYMAALLGAKKTNPIWIDLHTVSSERAIKVLESALNSYQGSKTDSDSQTPSPVSKDIVFILDNVDSEGHLIEALVTIARRYVGRPLKIVSTSNLPPHPSPSDYLGSLYLEVRVPDFSDEELTEFCLERGAPKSLLNRQFLNVAGFATRRYPQLVSALVQFLSARSWNYDEDAMKEVLRGDFADDVKLHTQRILIRTVSEPTRNLLYRLNVIGPVVSHDDVIRAGGIAPSIALPAEKLSECIGAWVQPIRHNVYMLSPTVTQLGSDNLSREMTADLHYQKARSIVSQGSMDQFDARIAVQHFEAADDYRSAAELLLIALKGLSDQNKQNIEDAGLMDVWVNGGIPDAVPADLGIIIRALQVVCKHRRGQSFENHLRELEALSDQVADIDPLAAFTGCALVAVALALDAFDEALNLAIKAIRLEPRIIEHFPEQNRAFVEMLWLILAPAVTVEALERWLTNVNQLDENQKRRLFNCELAAGTALVVCDRFWMREEDLPKEQQRWQALDKRLEQIEGIADSLKAKIVAVAIRRARIVIVATHRGDFPHAEAIAKKVNAALPAEDATGRFLIPFTLGVAAHDLKRWADCKLWLTRAIETGLSDTFSQFGEFLVRTYLFRAEASLVQNEACEDDLRAAVDRARAMPEVNELLLIRALGEYAIYLSTRNDLSLFYDVWNEAVERLIGAKADTNQWKELFVLVGNNSAYFAYELKGIPAEMQMTKPYAGMYLAYSPRLHALYAPDTEWMMAASMVGIAERCRRFGDCGRWGLRSAEMASDSQIGADAQFYLLYATVEAVRKRSYVEALEFVLSCAGAVQNPDDRFRQWATLHRGDKLQSKVGNRPKISPKINSELLSFVIPGIVLDLIIWEMTDPDNVQNAVSGVVDACTQLSVRSSDPEAWTSAAEGLGRVFGAQTQMEMISQARQDAGNGHNLAAAIGYLGSGRFHDDESTARSWMATIRFLHQQLTRSPLHYHLVSELMNRFWNLRLVSNPMSFRRPANLQSKLNDLAQQDYPSMRSTMKYVVQHLGLSPDSSLSDWLESDEQ